MHDKFQRFGLIPDPDDEILDAIKLNRPDYTKLDFERNKGDFVKGKAMVSYFTGDYDALPETETVLGKIHASRTIHTTIYGLDTKDVPYIEIDFDDSPTTLEDAWEKMRKVRQFFAWMMGYVPHWRDVHVFTAKKGENEYRIDNDGSVDSGHKVFGSKEGRDAPESAMHYGTLIDASRNPDHFMEVMKNWLARNEHRRRSSANARFFGSLNGSQVLENRIVSAGNTFDLLPSEDKPELPPKRSRIYLKEIVRDRLEVVLKHFGEDRLGGICETANLSVKCRNHYTHGPKENDKSNVDFSNFDVVHYLACTLEFIYGASELLICGWDETTATRNEWHPIGGYVKMYEYNRNRSGLNGK